MCKNLDKAKISSRNFIDLNSISTNNLNTETNQPSLNHLTESNDPRERENEPEIEIPLNETSQVQELRRSTQNRRANTRYSINEFVLFVDGGELECFEEAMVSEHKDKWLEVM
jgi:hypothetical protein